MIGCFIKLSIQTFQPTFVIYRRGYFVYYHWWCTSIYRPLSYPFRSLNAIGYPVHSPPLNLSVKYWRICSKLINSLTFSFNNNFLTNSFKIKCHLRNCLFIAIIYKQMHGKSLIKSSSIKFILFSTFILKDNAFLNWDQLFAILYEKIVWI